MLAYSLEIKPEGEHPLGGESFGNHLNVLSKILVYCMNNVIKKGIVRNYTPHTDETMSPHGHICISESVRKNKLTSNKLICRFDRFDERTHQNMAIKSVVDYLSRNRKLKKEIKESLELLNRFLLQIPVVPLRSIRWNKISYNGRDRDYRMSLMISRFIVQGMLPNREGGHSLNDFMNEGAEWKLFESFVRGYYEIEFKKIFVKKREIKWAIEDDHVSQYLPNMQSDMMLKHENKVLIVDTKRYEDILKEHWKQTYNSMNLYQIQSYVINWNHLNTEDKAEGMLLYAETDDGPIIDDMVIAGNQYHIRTINLRGKWKEVDQRLRTLIAEAGLLSD